MYTCRHSVFFAPWLALFAVPVILWTSYALSRADSAHRQGRRWASPSNTHAVAMAGPATRFVCLSDTHGIHTQKGLLKVPDGDVLLFGGDAGLSSLPKAKAFNAWLQTLPHVHKVVTFGNMDFWAEKNFDRSVLSAATHVLVDEVAEVAGFRIFASPRTPEFYGSFQLEDDEAGGAHWQKVLPPGSDVDIVMTHGPPLGTGDLTSGHHVGDAQLLQIVQALHEKPRAWVVGHIHAAYGKYAVEGHPGGSIHLYNAATNDLRSGADTPPMVFDLMPMGAAGQT